MVLSRKFFFILFYFPYQKDFFQKNEIKLFLSTSGRCMRWNYLIKTIIVNVNIYMFVSTPEWSLPQEKRWKSRVCKVLPQSCFFCSFLGSWSFIESGPFPAVEPESSSGGQTAGGLAQWVARVEPSGTTRVSLARRSSVTKPSLSHGAVLPSDS